MGLWRGKSSLLFSSGSGSSKLRVAVASVPDSSHVVLDAGLASDLGPGSELVQVTESGRLGDTRIRVQQVTGLTRSDAEVVGAAAAPVEIGDMFESVKWVPMQGNILKIWTPPATLGQEENSG